MSGSRIGPVSVPLAGKHLPHLAGADGIDSVAGFPHARSGFQPEQRELRQHPSLAPLELIEVGMPRRRIDGTRRNRRAARPGQKQRTGKQRVIDREIAREVLHRMARFSWSCRDVCCHAAHFTVSMPDFNAAKFGISDVAMALRICDKPDGRWPARVDFRGGCRRQTPSLTQSIRFR